MLFTFILLTLISSIELHIRISLGYKFQLQQIILIFRNNFPKHGYLQMKTEKININTEFFIFELV